MWLCRKVNMINLDLAEQLEAKLGGNIQNEKLREELQEELCDQLGKALKKNTLPKYLTEKVEKNLRLYKPNLLQKDKSESIVCTLEEFIEEYPGVVMMDTPTKDWNDIILPITVLDDIKRD